MFDREDLAIVLIVTAMFVIGIGGVLVAYAVVHG
jgi:hypothetical protein